jgi:hypothetical protein
MQAAAAMLGLAMLLGLAATASAKAPRMVEPILLSAPDAAATPSQPAPAATASASSTSTTTTTTTEPAAAEEESMWPTVSLDTTFVSKYVWRGLVLTDGPTWQPSATVAWKGLTLNVWGNLDLDDVNNLAGEFNEVDYTITYEHEIVGPLSGKIGFITYDFPNTAFHTTTEFMAGLTLDVPLSPSLTAFFDIDETDGVYLLAEIGHSFELPKLAENITASLDLKAGLGWGSAKNNTFYYGTAHSGPTDYYISLGLPVAVGDHVTITPNVRYTSILDDTARTAIQKDDNVVYGVSVTFSF